MADTSTEHPGARRADSACAARHATVPLARAIALALSLGAGNAGAATFTVTSAGDTGVGTLRDAVVTANQTPGPDVIEFAPGLGEIALQSEIVISETLDIVGPAGQQAIRGTGFSRLLAVRTAGAVITLQNLHLSNGGSLSGQLGNVDCQAYVIGRGTFASYGDGGAVCSVDDVTLVGTTITGSSLSGDFVSGGGLYSSGNVTLIDSTISNNSTDGASSRGGGLYAGGGLVMSNSVVTGNSTSGENATGGGLWFGDDAQIDNSVISGNSTSGAYADGGGLGGFGSLLLENSSVIGNSTAGARAEGGGIHLSTTSSIVNSTISGNSTAAVDAPGGGIFISGTNIAIANSTITANSSQAGAAGLESVAVETLAYAVALDSTILAGNTGPEGNFLGDQGFGTIIVDLRDSLFGDAASEVTGANAGNTFTDDPGLGPVGDNGCSVAAGATPGASCAPTHLPVAGSAAIDAGSNSSELAFDQRGAGFPRTVGAATDVGALEAELPPPPPVPADLAVRKTDGNVVIAPGEVLTWRIDFANLGELDGEQVALIETVPEFATFNPALSGDWVCDDAGAAGSACRFEVGTLPAGDAGDVQFSVIVDEEPEATEIVNEVSIEGADSDASDPNLQNNTAREITPISVAGRLVAPGRTAPEAGFMTGFADPETRAAVPRLGAEAAAIGDLDGDGFADVAVGAPGADSLLLVQGHPFATDALALPTSDFTSSAFPGFLVRANDGFGGLGDRIAGIGDVNGQGLDGLVFADAAINFNPLTGPARGAYVLPGFDASSDFVIDQGGRFGTGDVTELVSEQATGPFATSLAGLGDVNGDGLDDFALAFSFGTRPFQLDTVFVLFGDPGLEAFGPGEVVVEDASAANGLRLTSSGSPGSGFGTAISGIGDFNGDGVEDFAIGAPAQGSGAVFVVFGSPSLAGSSEGFLDTEGLDGANGFVLSGDENSLAFGARVAAAGDFDGDGFDDLLVGERRAAGEPGRAHIVFGTGADVPSSTGLDSTTDALRSTRILGAAEGDEFGRAGAGLGDLDGDGLDDIALGAPGLAESFDGQFGQSDSGRVFVLFGSPAPESELQVAALDAGRGYWLAAPSAAVRFGTAVAGPGDFDGDGVPDLLVTAPETEFEGIENAGQFWVVSGALRPDPPTGVAIGEFSVSPEALFAGETALISWSASPEVAVCTGSGLPGTSWNGGGKPASGATEVDTSSLEPGIYFPTLACEHDGGSVQAEATLEVLQPQTVLTLSGARTALSFFDDAFVQVELSNAGDANAREINLELDAPGGYEAIDIFRLAGACSEDDTGGVACDAASIPAWECEPESNGFACRLDALPPGGAAALVLQLRGSGPGQVEGRADAENSAPVSIRIPVAN